MAASTCFDGSELKLIFHCQGISQEGKKFCVLPELGDETQLGVWVHSEPLNGFSGGPRDKTLEKL